MADSADLNYTTFCPHCDTSLPPRAFRYHRERYYDELNDVWEKSNDASSDDEENVQMEINSYYENPYESDEHSNDANDHHVNEERDGESLLYHEVWDDTQSPEVDEDFVEYSETPPSVDVQVIGLQTFLSRFQARCTV